MKPTQISEALEASGVSVREIMDKTGLSDEGVRQCVRKNTLPKNPVIGRLFATALHLPEDWTPSAPSPALEQPTQDEA